MKVKMKSLKQFVLLVLNEGEKWREVDGSIDDDFEPVFKNWPKFAYHGTSKASAEKMLNGFTTIDDGVDFAFDIKLAALYGSLKTQGDIPTILKVEVRKLKPLQWAGIYIQDLGVSMNYDVGDDGFRFFGTVPKNALSLYKLVQKRKK